MNSYPHEFLGHPKPLMFVAGLSAAAVRPPTSALTEDTSPETAAADSPEQSASESKTSPGQTTQVDEFEQLKTDCRAAFEPFSRKVDVWSEKEGKERRFRILLVEKNIRLPPRKVVPTGPSAPASQPAPTPHSPLSPLLPGSPLHPDGLIAPVWVRKHAELVPSVFVLFLKLWESPTGIEDKEREREMDDQLVKEITERKKRLVDRGIKLTVVLMASRDMLENPTLDPRLSYLRRTSQLDTRASLFVLTPVPTASLAEFVGSLQDALIDAGIEFYATHTKKIRRKRGRTPPPSAVAAGQKRLGPQGWLVRYDYKAGWFAEVRGEIEVARRHYEDCWTELAKMFGSTTILPPRTKRWAEAKVLADCVAIKICKLFLYGNEGARALTHFHAHLHRFGELSRGWGIGEETFEFWSWIARQYRIFAELLELGLSHHLALPPILPPTLPTQAPTSAIVDPTIPTSSANPLQVLQRPGFYYYKAACCSIERKKRFDAALEIENDAMSSESGAASGYVSAAPGFANEKKVAHAALIVELFTKAYSLTKEQAVPQARLALFIAFRIAETYSSSGQWEMAMRFFDRIAKTYQRERWDPIVANIRSLWYECAQRTGAVEVAARLLLETMGQPGQESGESQESLVTLMQTTTPSTTDAINVELPEGSCLFSINAGFWKDSCVAGSKIPFQITVRGRDMSQLSFEKLSVSFSDGRPDVVVVHSDEAGDVLDIGNLTLDETRPPLKASLRWTQGKQLLLHGSLISDEEAVIAIDSVSLHLVQKSWNVILANREVQPLERWSSSKSVQASLNEQSMFPILRVTAKPHLLDVSIADDGPAYVGEYYGKTVTLKNDDDRALQVALTVMLQPTEEDDEAQLITIGDERSSRMLKEVSMGTIEPGGEAVLDLAFLFGIPGEKVVDISISSSIPNDSPKDADFNEALHTVSIQAIRPFTVSHDIAYRVSHTEPTPTLAALTFGADFFDKTGEAVVSLLVAVDGPRKIHVTSMTMAEHISERSQLVADSLAVCQSTLPDTWLPGDTFGVTARFDIGVEDEETALALPPSPAQLTIEWKSRESGELATTRIALPPLVQPPAEESFIDVLYHAPPTATLHERFDISISIRNSHPTVPASALSLQVSTSDSFAWVGPEIVKVPLLLPGQAWRSHMAMIPVGNAGWCALPSVDVLDGEGEQRQVRVRVMDAREERVDLKREQEDVMVFVKP